MIRIDYAGATYLATPGETLLDALLRQGADITHSCRKGSCGCCQLRLLDGTVDNTRAVDPAVVDARHVLCCVALPRGDLRLAPPAPEQRPVPVEVVARQALAPDIVALDLAPLRSLAWRAGQHVHLIRPDGVVRPYSIASAGGDWFFRIHVRRMPGGAMSEWLCAAAPGARLHLRGPTGGCVYSSSCRDRPLLLLATGTGAGALAALACEALDQGHTAPIELHHGVRRADDLHLDTELRALAARHANFLYLPRVSGTAPAGVPQGRIVSPALSGRDLSGAVVFLCGSPAMVQDARVVATLAGVPRDAVHADPFEPAHPRAPRDAQTIAAIAPDMELWAALQHGPGLMRILEEFYARVFDDARLAPFFQGIPRAWVIQKQYEFLARLFAPDRAYFGLNPYNAHHWMVISDELFDHREALFEVVLRDHALAPHLIRRWLALHERFRADIVKAAPRGMISDGIEQPLRTHSQQVLPIAALCDGCQCEIPAGAPSRYQYRIGKLHCATCAGLPAC